MALHLVAGEPSKVQTAEIDDDTTARSEILHARVDNVLRSADLLLARIDVVLGCPKAVGEERATGYMTGETAVQHECEDLHYFFDSGDSLSLSEVPETEFPDSIPETLRSSVELGFWGSEVCEGESQICDSPLSEAILYDRARAAELDPAAVEMMRILLPRYFEMVRSIQLNVNVLGVGCSSFCVVCDYVLR